MYKISDCLFEKIRKATLIKNNFSTRNQVYKVLKKQSISDVDDPLYFEKKTSCVYRRHMLRLSRWETIEKRSKFIEFFELISVPVSADLSKKAELVHEKELSNLIYIL